MRIDGLAPGERMIAWENDYEGLPRYQLVFEIGSLFRTEKGDVELSALEIVCECPGMVARYSDLDIGQLVAKKARCTRQPISFLSGQKAHGESRFDGLRGSPRCLRSRFRLSKRQPCMVEKGAAGGGQFDAVHAAAHQLDADLIFEIADLTTEGRLRRVQLFLGRDRQASGLGNRDEVAKVPQLHRCFPYLQGMALSLQSLLRGRQGSLHRFTKKAPATGLGL